MAFIRSHAAPPAPTPPPPPPNDDSNFFVIPSLADERATYTLVGRTYTASDELFTFPLNSIAQLNGPIDIHGDTEGDDLWVWLQQARRGYSATHPEAAKVANWKAGWLNYYKNFYLADHGAFGTLSTDAELDWDHTYACGLCCASVFDGDSVALSTAVTIGDRIRYKVSSNRATMALPVPSGGAERNFIGQWARHHARYTLTIIYLAAATNNAEPWASWRDAMIDCWMAENGTSWFDTTNLPSIVQGGAYFAPRTDAGFNGTGTVADWDAGRRVNNSFYHGLNGETLICAYKATGRADVRARLIKMAQFFLYYGHLPSHTVPLLGSYFGHDPTFVSTGSRYKRGTDMNDNTAACAYDASVINTLVWGYKLTGDAAYLNKARTHLLQMNKWSDEGQPGAAHSAPAAPDNEVLAFVDTRNKSGGGFNDALQMYNKGQLQYCYQVFENGGNPVTEAPAYVLGLVAFQSRELIGATYGPTVGQPTARQALLDSWATTQPTWSPSSLYFNDYSSGCEDRSHKRLFLIGGGHSSTVCNGVVYFDATNDGTGRPRGFFGVPGSFTPVSVWNTYPPSGGTQWLAGQQGSIAGEVPAILPDGRPNSCHSYHSPSFYGAGNKFYKLGRASPQVLGSSKLPSPSGGSAMGYIDMSTAAAWPNLSWNTSIPDDSLGDRLAGDQIIQSPDGTKALLFAHYSSYNNNGLAQFFRYATNTWGNTGTLVAPHMPPDGNGTGGHLVFDSVRNKLVRPTCNVGDVPGGIPNFGQCDVDWTNETISNAQAITINNYAAMQANTTSGGPNGRAVWFDANRRYRGTGALGVIWVYGNRADNLNSLAAANADTALHTITEIGYISATVREATTYNITGTKPRYTYSVDGIQSHGLGNRLVFVDEWRAVFVASGMNSGCFVIKLPDTTEVT